MKKLFCFAILMVALCSCTSVETEIGGVLGARGGGIHRFYATTEQSGPETKVYADEDMRVLWNSGDLLTVFNQSTYNSKFQFAGEDGDNAGDFNDVTASSLHSGNTLDKIYAVYPYASSNKINNAGSTITMTLPAEQQYKEHSFGIGANTMVAVTDNNFLAFKNLGGYLQLRLYGDNVSVSSITIQSNNGEKIAGKASVAVSLGAMPSVTMDGTATDAITLVCDPPVQLGATAEQYTDFWFVIPPTTFSQGFTITVIDEIGGVFRKTTAKSLTISRSTIEWMTALEVTPDYTNANVQFADANFKAYCVENFDTNHNGEISMAEAELVTEIIVNPEIVASLAGIEYFKNLYTLQCPLSYSYYTIDSIGRQHYYNANNEEIHSLLISLDVSRNTYLTTLLCSDNQLSSLDVSKNAELDYLNCEGNQIDELDVTQNVLLQYLYCGRNQLKSIDVSNNTLLQYLYCGRNQLTSLDVSNNTALIGLGCTDNQLTSLDVSKNTALTNLQCYSNQLTSLDVSKNTALTYLYCYYNQLTSLDVSNNTALTNLDCRNNQLTSLDVSKNTALTDLRCGNNQLTSLDVSKNTALTYLSCENNQLTSLDVSKNTALTILECHSNQLTSLDVSKNTSLSTLDCSPMNSLQYLYIANGQTIPRITENRNSNYIPATTEIVVNTGDNVIFADANFKTYCVENFDTNHDGEISYSEALDVTSISCYSRSIQSLTGIEHFKNLTYLNCDDNQLIGLDVSKNTALTGLNCRHNQLSSIDVSINTALDSLLCSSNQLTSLDVSKNTELARLECQYNQLTSLDVSKNTVLRYLYCQNNQLIGLDVSKNTALTDLYCYYNPLTSLDVSKNTVLRSLFCDNNQLTSLDVSKNTALTVLRCDNNQLTSLDVSENTALRRLSCRNNPLLAEIWLKTGQVISAFSYDTSVATIKYKD